jgi:hypothetical protein
MNFDKQVRQSGSITVPAPVMPDGNKITELDRQSSLDRLVRVDSIDDYTA